MAGFWSGLTHAGAGLAVGAAEGEDDAQRRMLALAAQQRAARIAEQEQQVKGIDALSRAADAGLTITPTGGSRSGDTSPDANSTGPTVRGEAGPAAIAKPTRVGTIAGMDVTVPEHLESKAVRSAREMKAAGLGPQQTLHERIIELRGQGVSAADAVKQARQEFGQDPDPTATHERQRIFDVEHPTRNVQSTDASGNSPKARALYVLKRASELQKPTRGNFGMSHPGMDRASAERNAGEEWDRVHNVDSGTPSGGDVNLTTAPTAGAGGAGSATQPPVARAKAKQAAVIDPKRVAKLRSDAAAAIAAGADSAAVNARLQQKLKGQ